MVRKSKSSIEKAVNDLKEAQTDDEEPIRPFAISEELVELWTDGKDLEKPENEHLRELKELQEQKDEDEQIVF